MQAVILAAGMGKRLGKLTQDNTKCMVKVNEKTLIERMLRCLDEFGLSRMVIVVGYKGKKLIDYIQTLKIHTEICFIENQVFDKTNNIFSLMLAEEYLLKDDTILLESDLIFDASVIKLLLDDPRESLALVDKYESWMDGTVLKIDESDRILEVVPGSRFKYSDIGDYYKTVNIYKFSRNFCVKQYIPFLKAYVHALGCNEYYEQVLRVITILDNVEIRAKRLSGQKWYEIDDTQDLDIAEALFEEDISQKYDTLMKKYGGYWRYSHLTDYCYLVNPYFPKQKMVDEITNSFYSLLTNYPSGQEVNSLVAARNFGVSAQYIAVGNGAAELIKAYMELQEGKTGIIRPSFEEYANRYNKDRLVIMDVSGYENLRYTVNNIISFFDETDIKNLILINPDNPSGNFINRESIISLILWADRKNINLLIDESFADFADDSFSLVHEDILDTYKRLSVIKSISKTYGIPGVRLGIFASGNEEIVKRIKKSISIWNINSIAEFYMQIFTKYKPRYLDSLQKIKQERKKFKDKLESIEGIAVMPSEANYFLVEITKGLSSRFVAEQLLLSGEILVKDATPKIGNSKQYIRIAIRDEQDNEMLCSNLNKILGG